MVEQINRNTEDIRRLEYWRDGNGAIGAEARLQTAEIQSSAAHRMIEDHLRIHERMNKRVWLVVGIVLADMAVPLVLHFLGVG